jgi:GH15 family glucan-1,4-alpha-glucosidase
VSLIEDYALIGDLHTAVLIGRDGSLDWMCLPHFDSPACFAALLGTPESGRWLLAPASGGACSSRRYHGDTLVLETDWHSTEGSVRIVDFMPPGGGKADVIRIVQGLSGSVAMTMDLRLRFDYGHIVPWVTHEADGIRAIAGPDAAYLRTPVAVEGRGTATVADFRVSAGDVVPFVLTWTPSHHPQPERVDASVALGDTLGFWQEWSGRSQVKGAYRDAVQRSLITLKAMTFAPTGGIVAAATTSLPEQIGGPRNWDYRYCWLRDATLTLQSLLGAGYVEEASAWREWLLRAIAGSPADLQIMYGLDGSRRLPEYELPWLDGYEGSLPVRVGNAAADQLQLDVWGEVLDGLSLPRKALLHSPDDSWDVQTALIEHLEGAWRQPDNGLWEVRGPRQHFTYSKVMAWVAADRMIDAVETSGLSGPVDRWRTMRDTIKNEVLDKGYDDKRGTFVAAYGSDSLDASLLLLGRVGFLPHTDSRILGTVAAIQRELLEQGFVMRYRTDGGEDGLPAGEGVFLACSFWLVDALHAGGRKREAVELFERLLELRNDVGLLSEEWDPVAKRQLGNTPQAFSHFPLVMSALQLHQDRAHRSDTPPHP